MRRKLTACHRGRQRDGRRTQVHHFPFSVYPFPAITESDLATGNSCNHDARRCSRRQQSQSANLHPSSLPPLEHFNRRQEVASFLLFVDTGAMRDLTPNDRTTPPEYPTEPLGCGCAISPDSKELAFTENSDPVPAISTSAQIYALDLTNPSAKPVKVSTSAAATSTPPTHGWKYWRGARRRARVTRATSFGWCCMTARRRPSRICCRILITGG